MIQEYLERDYISALKFKHIHAKDIIRVLLAELQKATIANNRKTLTQEQQMGVLLQEKRKYEEMLASAQENCREDIEQHALFAVGVINIYLPQQYI